MAEKRKPGPPSERGRNYTPLREVVHCALPGAVSAAAPVGAEPTSTGRCAPCGQQMISVDFQSAPIITGEARLPLRWLCQLPLCGLATRNLLTLLAISVRQVLKVWLKFFSPFLKCGIFKNI